MKWEFIFTNLGVDYNIKSNLSSLILSSKLRYEYFPLITLLLIYFGYVWFYKNFSITEILKKIIKNIFYRFNINNILNYLFYKFIWISFHSKSVHYYCVHFLHLNCIWQRLSPFIQDFLFSNEDHWILSHRNQSGIVFLILWQYIN